jgi:hypothetical protein
MPFPARLDWEVVPPDGADQAALDVAAGQQGVVTARQLGGCGLTRHDIARRVRSGWLRRRYRGVFVVGPVDAPHAAAMAAVLAVGDGALLSHEAAAVLRAMRVPAGGAIEVTVVGRDARGPADVRVHRTQALHPADATRHHGVPVTSPQRTLLDLATVLHSSRSPAQSRMPSSSASSPFIRSMSSSAVTRTTAASERCSKRSGRSRPSPVRRPSGGCSS